MITLYGIPNCDTVKKAQRWFEEHEIEFIFHNYKNEGISQSLLHNWCRQVGWKTLLNTRGTSWRKLSEQDQNHLNQQKACRLMRQFPSLIKRPVVERDQKISVGFDAQLYREWFLS